MEPTDKIRELIARALINADVADIHSIVTELVREVVGEHSCKTIIETAITPIIREIAAKVAQEPAVRESLEHRIRSEMMAAANKATISIGNRY